MKAKVTICVVTLALLYGGAAARAQGQKVDSPANSRVPAGAARGVSPAYNPEPIDRTQAMPDTNTLAGAQLFSVGSMGRAHNTFDPSISITQLGEVMSSTGGQSGLTSVSLLNGSVNFDRTWSIYHLTAIYNGGGTIYRGAIRSQDPFHDLSLTQQMDFDRWHFLFRDDFTAAPGAEFTGTGMGGPGLIAQFSSMMGASLNGVGQAFAPTETIETGHAMRYRNTILGQTEYSFSRRSAFTFSGSYGLLRFTQTGYISSHMVNAQAGYDYLLDPTNSIAVLASFGKIDYTGSSNSTTDYMVGLAYGRKITGRLAFQIGGGAQQIRSERGIGNFNNLSVSVNSALTYERRRSGMSISYMRGLSAGSGVFQGAMSDTVSGSAHYDFSRFWTGTLSGGYARNKSLAPAGATALVFSNWYTGGGITRRLGRHAQIGFNYGLQKQNSPVTCPVASCGINGFQQTFGMTLNWHLRPAG